MKLEKGIIGLISLKGRKFPIEQWIINHDAKPSSTAIIQCNSRDFRRCFEIEKGELYKLIKKEFLLRLDNEDHIYHGIGKVNAVALNKNCTQQYPKLEFPKNNLVILFDFICKNFGPFTIREGTAMARNGNDLFFDLLNITEIDERIKTGDLRFLNNHI